MRFGTREWTGLTTLACLGFLFFARASSGGLGRAFGATSYYLLLLLSLLWLAQAWILLRSENAEPKEFLKRNRAGLAFALAVAAFCFLSVPPNFRTLSDETNLLGISRSMFLERSAYNVTMGKWYYGYFTPILRELDKRRLLFPFLTSALHTATGYRYQNAFALNFLALFALLWGVFWFVRRAFDGTTGAAAVLLVAAQPVVTLFASSAGHDLLATALLFGSLAAAYAFMRRPTAESLAFLWTLLLVLCHARYESALYAALILGMLWAFGYLRADLLRRFGYVYALTPVMLLPVILQSLMFRAGRLENPPDVPAFGLAHVWTNARSAALGLVDCGFYLPYAIPLFAVSIGVVVLAAFRESREPLLLDSPRRRHWCAIAAAVFAAQAAVLLAYYAGRFQEPSSARLFMAWAVAASLLPVALRAYAPEVVTPGRLLLAALALVALYHPIAVENKFINTLTLVRETDAETAYLRALGEKRILVIGDRPGQFTALGYGAVDIGYANAAKADLLNELARHLYLDIVVFQRVQYGTGLVEPATALDGAFTLQTRQEIQITAESYMRISHVRR
ncbi:MAG: hypothetical protein HY078_11065 [Elusimicrobia bacterium]|nr:hypothetical protein [Elusimicrobiota bacterium]